ncbi:MAG TPA: hypothetical protein VGD37_26885 [Kofleriaceae bacterium]|jgi:hypothetical protein
MTRGALTLGLVIAGLIALGGPAAAQSLTLSPAVVPLGGRPGQSTSQRLTLFNGTSYPMSFALVAKDVVVRDGARVFVDAGETRGSIAATAVFSTRTVRLGPGEDRSVEVTLTLPAQMTSRAVVILFQGTSQIGGSTTMSIGSLLTFEVSARVSVSPGELVAAPPSASSNAGFTVPVVNDGSEPAIVRGAAVIVAGNGGIIGKVNFDARRLLPTERTALQADYPGELPRGSYRVIATIEGAKHAWTRTTELTVP